MAGAPGTLVRLRETPAPASAATDTTTWFVTGITERGPTTFPLKIRSVAEFERYYGIRVSYGILWDCVDAYFREGGSSVYVSRVVGPAATTGVKNLNDNAAAISLIVSALGPGAYSTGIFVGVVLGSAGAGTYQIVVTDGTNTLEQSGDLVTQADAVNWAQYSDYVRIAIGASALPPVVIAPSAMSAGADDRASITEAQWTSALNLFTLGLGAGQVSAPGRTTDPAHLALLSHSVANRRVAILDLPDTSNTTTLKTTVSACRVGNQRFGAGFSPWIQVPGVAGAANRTLPPSPLVAGLISRNESELGADAPAAGGNGVSRFVVGLSQPAWTDTQRGDLNDNAVNVIMLRPNTNYEVYGWRTLVNAVTDPNWINLGNSRLFMAIAADADAVAENFTFKVIDGQGHVIGDFGGSLTGMLLRWFQNGNLYGQSASEAFSVDVGAQVNTVQTIALNELHAVLNVRMSPFGERVIIEVVKTPITQEVA